MLKAIVDTDILSEYFKGHNSNVVTHAARYAQEHGIFTFTSVTVYEIAYGLDIKGATAQLQKAMAWLNQNEEIVPSATDYLTAASIRARGRKNGTSLELPDCLIASIAIRLNRPLVTGNTQDFASIRNLGFDLMLENWRNH